jgi:hypothetical protein
MQKTIICASLLFFSVLCFAQQNTGRFPVITGKLPDPDSDKLYRLQIGAFAIPWNAVIASGKLKDAGFNPFSEQYMHFTRVVITGVHAKDVPLFIERIGALGFHELFITEETAISEMPVINEPIPAAPPGGIPKRSAMESTVKPDEKIGEKPDEKPGKKQKKKSVKPEAFFLDEKWDVVSNYQFTGSLGSESLLVLLVEEPMRL